LFKPEDAELARHLPHNFASLDTLSKSLKIPKDELKDKLTEMAQRGLLFDIEHDGQRYYILPPIVIGLFEFIFMRTRPDMPMKEIARLFEEYFHENNWSFQRSVFSGKTQMFRTLVREEAIPKDQHAQVLDWERATSIVSSASAISVGLCQCHHVAQHMGYACSKSPEVCLSFNYVSESLTRNGIARSIT
jgi:hypothetical protein